MNIELSTLSDGNVIMVSDEPLPSMVKRIEYYREQRLFSLVYNNKDHGSEMMEYEIPQDMAKSVEATPNITIYSLFPDKEPIGYKVPLVKIGELFQ